MKINTLAPRGVALLLVSCLAVPSPALALRIQQKEDPSQLVGLEEVLKSGDLDSTATTTLEKIVAGLTASVPSKVPSDLLKAPAILVVLAGGEGTRMGGTLPKPAIKAHGKPMVRFPQDAARALGIPVVTIVTRQPELLREVSAPGVIIMVEYQAPKPLGTAWGVLTAEEVLRGYRGTILVAMGDMPWLEPEVFKTLLETHRESGADATYLTAKVSDPSGLARILRLKDGRFAGELQVGDLEILKQKKKSLTLRDGRVLTVKELTKTSEVGTGTYAFNARFLFDALRLIRNDNEKREFYLPSVLSVLEEQERKVSTATIVEETVMSVDTPKALHDAEIRLAKRSLAKPAENWTTNDWIAALDRALRLMREQNAIRKGFVAEGRPLADFLSGTPSLDTPWHRLGLAVLAEFVEIYGPDAVHIEKEIERYLRAVQQFEDSYGPGPVWLLRAPGRGILMGGHNDYNWGPELLVTLPVDTLAVVRGRADTQMRLASTDPRFPERQFDIAQELPPSRRGDWNRILEKMGVPPFDWVNYMKGSVLYWQNVYPEETLRGMDLLVDSTLPMERGISSSSALVVIAGEAIHLVNGKPVDRQHLAEVCCFAEWYVGTRGGGLDHAISILGQRGRALKLLPDSPEAVSIPLPAGYHFVMADSLVPADKTGSVRNAFNQRSAETRLLGVALFKARFPEYANRIRYLRDVTAQNLGVAESKIDAMVEQLPEAITTAGLAKEIPDAVEELSRSYQGLPEPPGGWRIRQRVRHIVRELRRVDRAVEALRQTDMATFGKLMDEAFASYRDDYEITVPDIEELVGLAKSVPGVLGANLQGGGFGGFTMILTPDEGLGRLTNTLLEKYYKPRGLDRSQVMGKALFVATPSRGAGLVMPQRPSAGLEEDLSLPELYEVVPLNIWPETIPRLTFTRIEPIFIFQAAGGFGDAAYLVKLVDGFNAHGIVPIVAVVGTPKEQEAALAKFEHLKKDIPVVYTLWHERDGRLVEEGGKPVAGDRNLRPVLIQHFSLVSPDWAKDTADRLIPQLFQPLYQRDQQSQFLLIGYSETGNVFGGYLKPDQGNFLNLYLTSPTVAGPHEPNPIYTGHLFDRQLRALIEEGTTLTRPQLRDATLRQLLQVERLKLSEELIQAAKAKDNWALLYTSQGGSPPQMDALIQAFLRAKKSAAFFTFFGDNPRLWYYPDHYWKPHREMVDHLKENPHVSFVDLSGIFGSQEREGAPILVINLPVFPLGTLRRLSIASDLLLAPGQNSFTEAIGMAQAGVGPKVVLPFPLYHLQGEIHRQVLRSIGATRTSEEVASFHHLRDGNLTQAEFERVVQWLTSLLKSEEEQQRFRQDTGRLATLAIQRSGNPTDGNLGNRILDLLTQVDKGVTDKELITAPRQEIAAIQRYQQETAQAFRNGQEPAFPAAAESGGLEEAVLIAA